MIRSWIISSLIAMSISSAAPIEVTRFTDMRGGMFYDAPMNQTVEAFWIRFLRVTPDPNPTVLNGFFGGFRDYYDGPSPIRPGNGFGFGSRPDSPGHAPLVLDFSRPLTAFGATLFYVVINEDRTFTFPITIEVFSEAGASGELLGTTTDPGRSGRPFRPFWSFRGIVTGGPSIRSARISAASPDGGYFVDSIAISEVPEPATAALAFTALALIGAARWRRSAHN